MENKLTILGSGTFFLDTQVTASSFLLEVNGKKILIDAGPGTLVKLAQAGTNIFDLDYVFITHFHADHTSDLFPLFMEFRLTDLLEPNKVKKFPVFYGPEGFYDFMVNLSKVLQMEAFEGWDKIKVKEYNNKVITLDSINVHAFDAEHTIFNVKANANALRFEFNDTVLAISGDSTDCPGVRKVSKNADVFLCDASFPKTFKPNTAHMLTSDIGRIASDSNVKTVLLYHLYPQYADINLIAEVKEFYNGPVRKVKDLEVIKL